MFDEISFLLGAQVAGNRKAAQFRVTVTDLLNPDLRARAVDMAVDLLRHHLTEELNERAAMARRCYEDLGAEPVDA